MQALRPYTIALLTGALPLIAIHISYIWAASNGHVEWCIPYIDSCTSISAIGRKPPETYLFKGLMLIASFFFIAYYLLSNRWLKQLGCTKKWQPHILVMLGWIGAVCLIIYIIALGQGGDSFRITRRVGVTVFIGFNYLAQCLLLYLLSKSNVVVAVYQRHLIMLLVSLFVILIIGIVSVIIGFYDTDLYHRVDDAFEWTLCFLLSVHILITGLFWRQTTFSGYTK